MIAIEFPWPHRWLNPNARTHWARKAQAVKKARADAAWCAKAAGIHRNDFDIPHNLKVTIVFSPPDNRHRDTDNMLSSCKSMLDGVADVVGIDDSKWEISLRREAPVKGGSVRIELEAAS